MKLELKNKMKSYLQNIFFLPFKNLSLSNPEIDYKWLDEVERKINITVKSKYAKEFYSSAGNSNFNDNFFDLGALEQNCHH